MIVGLRSLARLLLVGAALCASPAVARAMAPEQVEADDTVPEDDSAAIAGETQYAIAQATGVNQSVLNRFVNGERGISLETAAKLC